MAALDQIEFLHRSGAASPTAALRLHRPALPDAEARVADAVLAEPRLVTSESVGDLAERAGTSTATIVRLCRRVGFEGFYHFKIALAEEVGLTRQFGHPDVTSRDPTS